MAFSGREKVTWGPTSPVAGVRYLIEAVLCLKRGNYLWIRGREKSLKSELGVRSRNAIRSGVHKIHYRMFLWGETGRPEISILPYPHPPCPGQGPHPPTSEPFSHTGVGGSRGDPSSTPTTFPAPPMTVWRKTGRPRVYVFFCGGDGWVGWGMKYWLGGMPSASTLLIPPSPLEGGGAECTKTFV